MRDRITVNTLIKNDVNLLWGYISVEDMEKLVIAAKQYKESLPAEHFNEI